MRTHKTDRIPYILVKVDSIVSATLKLRKHSLIPERGPGNEASVSTVWKLQNCGMFF